MSFAQHQRRGQRAGADEATSHLEQRLEIDAAVRQPACDVQVHNLLAAEPDAADEPVHRGMEPQGGAHRLLGDR